MVYMEHNEAQGTETVTVATVNHCASLLRVSPTALLRFVLEVAS